MKINVYQCRECKMKFDVRPEEVRNAICPRCASMNIKFVKSKQVKNG